jgi:hypothetical protein
MPSVYKVEIKQHEEFLFATCESLPGLFIGHKDYGVVLKNLPEAITMLIKHDCGTDVLVEEAKQMEPTLLGNKTYVVTNRAAA